MTTTNTLSARARQQMEAHRRRDGQFGSVHHDEPAAVVAPVASVAESGTTHSMETSIGREFIVDGDPKTAFTVAARLVPPAGHDADDAWYEFAGEDWSTHRDLDYGEVADVQRGIESAVAWDTIRSVHHGFPAHSDLPTLVYGVRRTAYTDDRDMFGSSLNDPEPVDDGYASLEEAEHAAFLAASDEARRPKR